TPTASLSSGDCPDVAQQPASAAAAPSAEASAVASVSTVSNQLVGPSSTQQQEQQQYLIESEEAASVGQFDNAPDDNSSAAASANSAANSTAFYRSYSRPAWYESIEASEASQWPPWQLLGLAAQRVVFPRRPCFQPIGGGDDRDRVESSTSLTVSFSPPLYKQRYTAAFDLLVERFGNDSRRPGVIKLIDLGAAECRLFSQSLKFLRFDVDYLAVDYVAEQDPVMLEAARQSLAPTVGDYMKKRSRPMRARLLAGCATEPDARLAGADAALLVEMIEHLPLDQLARLPGHLFGQLRPGLVVVTTPNAEFNTCFGPRFPGLRHHDHKFEWTRAQFQAWSQSIARRYGYAVRFTGVGDAPDGLKMIGHCSQIAVFTLLPGPVTKRIKTSGDVTNHTVASGDVTNHTVASGDVTNHTVASGDATNRTVSY
uniref:Small RNA 2'-O-methyltransferase n=1 Tax=Macrostomum lignano TaxID=282301 RepID=A0A1I8JJ92_9PLAT